MGFKVVTATPASLATVFTLLPHLMQQNVPWQSLLIATHGSDECGDKRIVGAAGFSITPVGSASSSVRADLFVRQPWRRQGIGTALLAQLREHARSWDIAYLHGWQPFSAGPARDFALQVGMTPLKAVSHYAADAQAAHGRYAPLLARLRQRGRIPFNATLVPLADANPGAAVQLYARHFGITEPAAATALARALALPGPKAASLALLLDDVMIGLILWKIAADGTPQVELWIVEPGHRHGWPGILLLQESIERMMALGHVAGNFEARDGVRATHHVAQQVGARLTLQSAIHVIAT